MTRAEYATVYSAFRAGERFWRFLGGTTGRVPKYPSWLSDGLPATCPVSHTRLNGDELWLPHRGVPALARLGLRRIQNQPRPRLPA